MKKRGFTLIELLAVIVVLAIIALIATPIVMNVIKNAQMGAAERSADNYIKAVETLIATEQLGGKLLKDGEYTIGTDGNITIGENTHEVEVSGTKPISGKIVIENGQVNKDSSTVSFKDYTITFEGGKAEAGEGKKPMTLADCDLQKGYTANTIGAKYVCNLGDRDRTFYVLEAGTNSKPVTLILEGNYDVTAQSYEEAVTNKLNEISLAWNRLEKENISLPRAELIAQAVGESLDNYVFLGDGTSWLCSFPDNPNWGADMDGSINRLEGYWTSTVGYDSTYYAVWYHSGENYAMMNEYPANSSNVGVRPVITLSI